MFTSIRLLAAALLLVAPVAEAAQVTITLKNGQVVTYDMNNIQSIVISNGGTTVTPAPAPGGNFAGVWRTDDGSIGKLTLTQRGNAVTGTYEHANGRVNCTVNGHNCTGEWIQDNARGGWKLTLSADGKILKGAWSYAGSSAWNSFTATRS